MHQQANQMLVDGKPCTIQYHSESETYLVRRLSDGAPETMGKAEFFKRAKIGRIKALVSERIDPKLRTHLNTDLSAFRVVDIREAERRADYCLKLIEAGEPSPQGIEWKPIIDTLAREKGERAPKWKNVADWVRKYKEAEGDFRVLIPRTYARGRRIIVRDKEEKKVIQEFIGQYLTMERPVPALLYENMKVRYHQECKANPFLDWKIMSRTAFYEMLNRLDEFEVTRRRYGPEIAKTKFKHGGRGPVAEHPLDIVEIDATEADVEVWNDEMTAVIGRPWVYVAIDRCTRMVVGIYVGFEPPSTYSLLQCIKNAVLPKDRFNDEFPDIPVSWDAWGPFLMAVTDNSKEALGNGMKAILGTLGTEHRLAPVKTPEFKGIVERFNRTFNEDGTARLPGKTFNNVVAKGNYISSTSAILTISQFRYYIHYWLLVDYCYDWHDGLGGVPALFWKERIKGYQPRIPPALDQIDGMFGELQTATLSKTGLTFLYLEYKSEYLTDLHCKYGNVELSFKVDSVDLGYIYVVDPDTKRLCPVPCEDFAYADGLTLHQHRQVRKLMTKAKTDWKDSDERLDMRAKLIAWTENKVAEAKATAKRAKARLANQGVVQPSLSRRRGKEALELLLTAARALPSGENPFSEEDVSESSAPQSSADVASNPSVKFFKGGRRAK